MGKQGFNMATNIQITHNKIEFVVLMTYSHSTIIYLAWKSKYGGRCDLCDFRACHLNSELGISHRTFLMISLDSPCLLDSGLNTNMSSLSLLKAEL